MTGLVVILSRHLEQGLTLLARFTLPGDQAKLPGPGAYIPEKVGAAASSWFQWSMTPPR